MPRVLNGLLRSSMLPIQFVCGPSHCQCTVAVSSACIWCPGPCVVFGLLVPPCGLWFTQAFCLRHCPSRFQPCACASTCVYAHSALIPDDSALAWFVACASSQVQSGLGISRMFHDAHISQVASAAASKATLNVQEVQAVAAFRAGVHAFVSCFTLVGLFVHASIQFCWITLSRMFSVATSFWTESEFHFLSASKGFVHKEDKQIRKVEGLAAQVL